MEGDGIGRAKEKLRIQEVLDLKDRRRENRGKKEWQEVNRLKYPFDKNVYEVFKRDFGDVCPTSRRQERTIGQKVKCNLMEMKPDIENMTLNEYLKYEAEKESLTPLHPCFLHVQPYPKNYFLSTNVSNNVDIDNMTIAEYNLYVAKQGLDKNPLNNHSYGFTPHFFAQPSYTPNTPVDNKDFDFDKSLDDLFRIGAENVKRMGQDILQDNDLEEDRRMMEMIGILLISPTTKPVLDELLEDNILNVAIVDEEADPTRDLEEPERLLVEDPHFTEIQVHSVITKPEPFIHTQPMSPLYGIFESYKSSTKPYKVPLTKSKLESWLRSCCLFIISSKIQESFVTTMTCAGYVRFDNQSIERDRLIGIGLVLDFVKFISFTFSDKEIILILGGDQLLVILCGFGTKSLEFGISFLSMTISGAASYAFSDSLLLTPLCCDDIHDFTPRVSALAVCDKLSSLIPLSRRSFDVLVGMDRLSKRKFGIVCHEKVVRILLEGDEILRVHGERTQGVVKTLMNTKVGESKLSDISVVQDFIDMFPEDLSMTTTTTSGISHRFGSWSDHPQADGQSESMLRTLEDIMRECVIDFGGSYHLIIWCAPFEALYGRKCRSHVIWAEIGGSSLIGPELGKLAPRYVGPFEILERIGPVAYRLRLPEELSGVHDTFHVSNLKKCLADASLHVPLDKIKVDKTLCFVEEPVEIIDREVKRLKCSKIVVVRVHLGSKRGL
ncbi:putative reverse transcriptase domain-containing protein [Tanacetum coccineum]